MRDPLNRDIVITRGSTVAEIHGLAQGDSLQTCKEHGPGPIRTFQARSGVFSDKTGTELPSTVYKPPHFRPMACMTPERVMEIVEPGLQNSELTDAEKTEDFSFSRRISRYLRGKFVTAM